MNETIKKYRDLNKKKKKISFHPNISGSVKKSDREIERRRGECIYKKKNMPINILKPPEV